VMEDSSVGDGSHQHVGRRGELRILLGAAPGVGKTYAMLREAHRLHLEGKDIVIGFVETHGRPDTAAQIGDLEVIPRKTVIYQGIGIEEMDTEAIVHRRPKVAIVDELAHTNAPGSLREKRYQDVEALRDAGIDVLSALNIQHLASLQDLVAGITGIAVRESIPDQVLADATEIQLVDLPVEALIQRIEQGKVYPPERSARALQGFFQPGNLTALREMALRRTAEGVDARLAGMMLGEAGGAAGDLVTPTERVLVLVVDDPEWGDVLRNAWRLASGMRAELIALTVAPLGLLSELPSEQANRIRRLQELAEDLGAKADLVSSEGNGLRDDAEAIVRALRATRATILVIGVHPRTRKWWELSASAGSGLDLALAVMQLVDGVDIHMVKMSGSST
jgi:two-component system sensor histidine kinase KdpD